ncbi:MULTISPECIES: DUF4199 domain-containing protein [Hymenobacter]|uniref:DUF4199 family protein n=1 Tax=Hymenobacter profundi TaxID=1982110 RepID=A0ABS6WW65_9BACT|nr:MULTISPECIES: DUF4199 domain-containing protein [Hymenobacter]MBW3126988.1 DUF4199 family protein [Hymenobacter profundi]MBW3127021.1 DUF4199 family protein [Hymenobacter profundi]QNE39294.1 DUF4199 domain-containing protein [Hymenobacter sp. NBH84]
MSDTRLTSEKNGLRYGIYTTGAMIIYFLVASLFDLTDRIEFSFLNGIIMSIGVTLAIRHFKYAKDDHMAYLQGLGTGIITGAVAGVLFGLFFVIYATINPALMDQISARDLFGYDLSVVIAFLAIVLQSFMGASIVALIAMQYYKSPDHKPIEEVE